MLFWRSVPCTANTVRGLFHFQISTTALQQYQLPLKASLTTSVPAAVSWSRQTQSHAWGALFLKTTFSTDDVPKYTGPNQRQDSGTPCKESASLHENHLEGGSNTMDSHQGSVSQLSTTDSDLHADQRPPGAGPPPQL